MEDYTIRTTHTTQENEKGGIGELRPNWPMFSMRLVISTSGQASYRRLRHPPGIHLRGVCIVTANAPLTIPQFAKAKLSL